MGNSGSMHNLASIDDQQFIEYQRQQLQIQQQQWAQSFPRPAVHPQIKVLPEIVPGSKFLRTTNNGAILHNGGTLTNRKDLPIQRSKSISAPHFPHHPNMGALRERSRTQMNMIEERETREQRIQNYKKFGSEPDLRASGDENTTQQTNSKANVKIARGKKKKVAPQPPAKQNEHNYDPSRFGWKPKTNPPQIQPFIPKEPPPRKLRLFKTKAESKKTPSQSNQSENLDQYIRQSTLENRNERETSRNIVHNQRDSYRPYEDKRNSTDRRLHHHNDMQIGEVSNNLEWKQSGPRVITMPEFRREKSFDVNLLSSRTNQIESFLKNRRQRAPSPTEQKSRTQKYPAPVPIKLQPEPPKNLRKIKEDSKDKLRKVSQPSRASIQSSANSVENLSGTSFQQELLEATRRRSALAGQKEKEKEKQKAEVKPMPRIRNIKKDIVSPRIPLKAKENKMVVEIEKKETKLDINMNTNNDKPDKKISNSNATPSKTFYFGMDENAEPGLVDNILEQTQLDAIDRFAESLMKRKPVQRLNESSESALSSDVEDGAETTNNEHMVLADGESEGISLQLRPTLPKKQFEIPRFSPAAAWRLLAPEDDQKESSKFYHPEKLYLEPINSRNPDESSRSEDRIERIYREPIPGLPDNKSGDSGISGDAGLPERDDSPRHQPEEIALPNTKNVGPFLSAWTPQQDLEEESSSDCEIANSKNDINQFNGNRGHVFSLSLPREVHLASHYSEKSEKQSFTTNSLQKLKKTVSGAFSGSSNNDKNENYRSDNWLLSRSAPNSIDNCKAKPMPKPQTPSELEEIDLKEQAEKYHQVSASIMPPSFRYLTGGKHMMYLPHHPIGESSDYKIDDIELEQQLNDTKMVDNEQNIIGNNFYEKEREDLQDPPTFKMDFQIRPNPKSKNHRFTFQSTVRQIERRKIADKLSKEAEQKEAQRLSELEAMRRVEEEFQKKRAREKASIRQQLRLYSMEESHCSLPMEWSSNARAEPDGAVSSPAQSPVLPKSNIIVRDNLELEKRINYDDECYIDTKTPYISRIVEQKSSKFGRSPNMVPKAEKSGEFQSSQREYLDYRGFSTKTPISPNISSNSRSNNHPTEHPTIVCNIPSSGGGYVYGDIEFTTTDNYRREFARGGRSINSSDSEISGFSVSASGKHRNQLTSRF